MQLLCNLCLVFDVGLKFYFSVRWVWWVDRWVVGEIENKAFSSSNLKFKFKMNLAMTVLRCNFDAYQMKLDATQMKLEETRRTQMQLRCNLDATYITQLQLRCKNMQPRCKLDELRLNYDELGYNLHASQLQLRCILCELRCT